MSEVIRYCVYCLKKGEVHKIETPACGGGYYYCDRLNGAVLTTLDLPPMDEKTNEEVAFA